MQTARHYYITTLPTLGELGSDPPMGLADLVEHAGEQKSWREHVEAVVLLDDLLQREAFLAGEIEEVEPAVLSLQQVQGEAPLPEMFSETDDRDRPNAIEADVLWERYFRYVHELGKSRDCAFLVRWVEFEVALRNGLATARAKRLGLDESAYLVAPDLNAPDENLSLVQSEWEAATTPLAGLRVVIRARWSWIEQHDAWFSFSVDELLAYAVRVMLLEQWRRTASEEETVA